MILTHVIAVTVPIIVILTLVYVTAQLVIPPILKRIEKSKEAMDYGQNIGDMADYIAQLEKEVFDKGMYIHELENRTECEKCHKSA